MANMNSIVSALRDLHETVLRIEKLMLTITVPQATEATESGPNAAQEHQIAPTVQKRRGRPPTRRD